MVEYDLVHVPYPDGEVNYYPNYGDQTDRLHAECCSRATKEDQLKWCNREPGPAWWEFWEWFS